MPLTDQPVKGMYIKDEGRYFFLQDRMLKTQGRQGGLITMKLKALDNGQVVSKTIKSGTKVEFISPTTQQVQYMYRDDSYLYFMNMETFETMSIYKDIVGEYAKYLKEGENILVLMYEGQILSITENPSVILEITKTDDAVKGNTANAATKLATVETGYQLQTPLFVKEGDKIKINTQTGEYIGKAN